MKRELSNSAKVAKAIRTELKKHGIPASVTSENYSGGNSVNVRVTDIPPTTLAKIKAFCAQFEYGHFDGMTDCYNYSNRRDDIPQTKYLFVNCEYSDDIEQLAWDYVRENFAGYDALPKDYKDAKNEYLDGEFVQGRVYRLLAGHTPSPIWAAVKPRIKI